MSAQRRLIWSCWANAKANLSLRWVHSHFVGFAVRRLNLLCVTGMHTGKWIKMKIMKSRGARWSRLNHFLQTLLALLLSYKPESIIEPRHDKTNKMNVRPAKKQISLGIHLVWSESSLCAEWVARDPSFLLADSEDSDQTGRMPRLIWVFAGCTVTSLVLSCRGSIMRTVKLQITPVFAVRMKKLRILCYQESAQRTLVSDTQTFFSLRRAHKSFCRLCWALCSILPSRGLLSPNRAESVNSSFHNKVQSGGNQIQLNGASFVQRTANFRTLI